MGTRRLHDWLRESGEKILITDSVSVSRRMIRRDNRDNAETVTKDVKPITLAMLAEELLYAYRAYEEITAEIEILDDEKAGFLFWEVCSSNWDKLSFLDKASYGFDTCNEIFRIVNFLRMGHPRQEDTEAFPKKLGEIKELKKIYEDTLVKKGYFDKIRLYQNGVDVLNVPSDAQVCFRRLLLGWGEKVSVGYTERQARLWFGVEKDFFDKLVTPEEGICVTAEEITYEPEQTEEEKKFVSCYGNYNEVSYVRKKITDDKLKFGDVCVYYTSKEYENIIRSVFGAALIPVCFTKSAQASEIRLVQFMLDVLQFVQDDYSYKSLQKVVRSTILDLKGAMGRYNRTLQENIGFSKERYKEYYQRKSATVAEQSEEDVAWINFLGALPEIFDEERTLAGNYEALLKFTQTYTYKKNQERQYVMSRLKDQIGVFGMLDCKVEKGEQIEQMRRFLSRLTYRESEMPDAVRAAYISGADCMDRSYNFILGLSYGYMMRSEVESPVLSDDELTECIQFENNEVEGVFSQKRNNEYVKNLERLLKTLAKGQIYLCYSRYDMVNFKEMSPSIFYAEQRGETPEENISGYPLQNGLDIGEDVFSEWYQMAEPSLRQPEKKRSCIEDVNKNIEQELLEEKTREELPEGGDAEKTEEKPPKKDITLSASSVQTMLACPLSYYYHYEKGLPKLEFSEWNAAEWLSVAEKGTFFHLIMKLYCDAVFVGKNSVGAQMSEQDFLAVFQKALAETKLKNPISNFSAYEKEKADVEKTARATIMKLHQDFSSPDSGTGETWKVLGCEIGFGGMGEGTKDFDVDYMVTDAVSGTSKKLFSWKGSIDRMDGYMDTTDTLHFRIIDYKTGKKEKLERKVDGFSDVDLGICFENKQIQHYVYADAALEYIRKNQNEIASIFGKTSVKKVEIDKVAYYFPYESEKNKEFDVTSLVEDAVYLLDEQDELSKKVSYPKEMTDMLDGMFKSTGVPAEDFKKKESFMERCVEKRLEEEQHLLENSEKNKKELSSEFTDGNQGCVYCSFADICRMHMKKKNTK